MDDKLKDFEDFEKIEDYKTKLKRQRTYWTIVSIFMFIIGFLIARLIYKYHHLLWWYKQNF